MDKLSLTNAHLARNIAFWVDVAKEENRNMIRQTKFSKTWFDHNDLRRQAIARAKDYRLLMRIIKIDLEAL